MKPRPNSRFQFRLVTLLFVMTAAAVVIFLYGRQIANAVWNNWNLTGVFFGTLLLVLFGFLALIWRELLSFFFPQRSRDPKEKIDVPTEDELGGDDSEEERPKKLRWKQRPKWHQSNWTGPGGYR